jgi:hypothetical protein
MVTWVKALLTRIRRSNMSKILKGLNEANPHNYDSDWDYQDAVARSGKSRSNYRSQEDDTSDADIEYSKKMYQLSQKQKRDADHDRLASGTNEEQLDELSNEKLGQYKTAATADAGKADKEGDYKRGDKRFSGIVKATKKQFANDTKTVKEDINVVYKKAKQLLTQLDENTQQRVINALTKRVVKEFEGDIETITAPTSNNQPSRGFAIKVHGPIGSSPRIGGFPALALWEGLSAVFPDKYPPKDFQNLGAQFDSPQAKVFNQIQRAGSAVVANGIASRDLAETLAHKLATFKPSEEYIGTVGKKFVEVIEQGMDEATEQPAEPFKTGYPRVKNPQILGTQNRAKSIYHPPSKPNVKKLDKPLPESLGDELTSKSIQALQQVKQQLEQQRMAELEQWEKDFKQNTVSKFTAREPNLRQRATSTSMVAMPGEKHSELKTRLGQLNKAIEKQGILDNLVQKLDKKGLMTPNIEAGVDTSMLARDGARDNYVELNKKLDKALEYVKNRLLTNKAAYAKPKAIDENDSVPTRMKMSDYYDLADNIQEKLKQAIQTGDKARIQELNKQRDELDAHVKKHGMMPEAIDEEQLDELSCWSGYHRVAGTKAGFPGSCAKNKTNESEHSCPHCGGEMVSEELMNEKKDACYYKVKSRYKVWPSAYASGALVKCRNKGASNWGNGGKKNESSILEGINRADESLHDWFNKEKWVRMDTKGKIKGPCAREPGEGKPKCLPQSKAHSLGKKGRASAAQRKRREDPNPERSGKAINVNTKKQSNESIEEGWRDKIGAAALTTAMALGAAGANADTRRVTPDGQGGFIGGLKPSATVQAEPKPATPSTGPIPAAQAQYDNDTQVLTYKGKQYKWDPKAQSTGQGEVVSAPSMAVGSRSMGPTNVELNPNGTYKKAPVN